MCVFDNSLNILLNINTLKISKNTGFTYQVLIQLEINRADNFLD